MALESTSTLAVLSDDGLLMYSYATKAYSRLNIWQKMKIDSLGELLILCFSLEINTLWMVPGSRLSRDAKELMELRRGVEVSEKSTVKKDGTPLFLLIQDLDRSVKIAWPEWDNRWPWQQCSDAPTLLKSLLYLQDALEVKVEWSPGRTGQRLMLQLNEKRKNWFAPVELPDEMKKHVAVDRKWKRPLTEKEQQPGMYFHAFDKNSAYLGACTSALLGEGEPELRISPFFDPRLAGLWHIPEWDRWIWTPELEYLFAGMEERPIIHEAYIWPKSHQALRTWGEHMWKARQMLKMGPTTVGQEGHGPAMELAYKAVKRIYTQALGWLTFDRPDWWSMIVAGALRSTGFKQRQMAYLDRHACFWNADMLCFISEGESLMPYERYMLSRVGRLGGFKHVGSAPLTPDLAATFEENVSWETCHTALLAALGGNV